MEVGCHVLDAGEVGTEVLYYLVGSRSLDGGAMITASHNPKAYTGVKLVREGALPLSGDAGIGDLRDMIAEGLPRRAPGAGTIEVVDVLRRVPGQGRWLIRGGEKVKPMKLVVDGGNGMAGPMVGPLLHSVRDGRALLQARRQLPRPRAEPAARGEPRLISKTVTEEGADLGIAWDGDADRCFFIDSEGTFVDGDFLRPPRRVAALQEGRRPHPLRRPRQPGRPRHRRGSRRHLRAEPRRPRLLQGEDARDGRDLRRRGLGPLLLQGLLQRRLGNDPRDARPGVALREGGIRWST